jgi:hypothetical protein
LQIPQLAVVGIVQGEAIRRMRRLGGLRHRTSSP